MSDDGATLVIRNARVVTLAKDSRAAVKPIRGDDAGELHILERADIYVSGERITDVRKIAANARPRPALAGAQEIDAAGRVVMPGLVDCHTHACWAGSRLDEWDQKRRGVPYLKILKQGGGIMATVRAVRAASVQELTDALLPRITEMLALGSTTIEVKSGYGLTTADELKMLHAVRDAQRHFAGMLVPTALLGHALDDQQPGFVGRVVRETLPAVVAEFPGIAVDAYCEQGAWSVEQCIKLFSRARELGCPVRVHADQFNSLGMIPAALHLEARSIDHLEASKKDELALLAKAPGTFAVALPACGFHMDGRYARVRGYTQQGGALCIASNLNPGSAPCGSMPFVIALAVRHLGLSPQEAIVASTRNPALLLGLPDRGAIAPGLRADMIMLKDRDERAIGFEFGSSPVRTVIAAGRIVRQ
jgi:imidazolonepropionase